MTRTWKEAIRKFLNRYRQGKDSAPTPEGKGGDRLRRKKKKERIPCSSVSQGEEGKKKRRWLIRERLGSQPLSRWKGKRKRK